MQTSIWLQHCTLLFSITLCQCWASNEHLSSHCTLLSHSFRGLSHNEPPQSLSASPTNRPQNCNGSSKFLLPTEYLEAAFPSHRIIMPILWRHHNTIPSFSSRTILCYFSSDTELSREAVHTKGRAHISAEILGKL